MVFNKIKDYFGIEGLKVFLEVEEEPCFADLELNGSITFETMRSQQVTAINIELIEKYERGKKDSKLINEFTLGQLKLETNFIVNGGEYFEVPFRLPFQALKSSIENSSNNIFAKAQLAILKKMYRVKSSYYIKSKISVEGTGFQPVAQIEVVFGVKK